MMELSYRRHRFPPAVIQHAVWLYLRFTLSYRDVEELLAERGLDISYENVRSWVLKFGQAIARGLRRCRPRPSDRWHLDEMLVRIAGKHMYLWRAVDREGKVLEEENGLEIDQSSLERRRPFSRGDQRFESPLLHRRITLSSHFSITGTTWAAPAPRVNRELLAPRRSRRRRLERTVDLFDRAALGFAAEDHRNRSLPTASR